MTETSNVYLRFLTHDGLQEVYSVLDLTPTTIPGKYQQIYMDIDSIILLDDQGVVTCVPWETFDYRTCNESIFIIGKPEILAENIKRIKLKDDILILFDRDDNVILRKFNGAILQPSGYKALDVELIRDDGYYIHPDGSVYSISNQQQHMEGRFKSLEYQYAITESGQVVDLVKKLVIYDGVAKKIRMCPYNEVLLLIDEEDKLIELWIGGDAVERDPGVADFDVSGGEYFITNDNKIDEPFSIGITAKINGHLEFKLKQFGIIMDRGESHIIYGLIDI